MPISYTTSQNNELVWEGSQCLKSLVPAIWATLSGKRSPKPQQNPNIEKKKKPAIFKLSEVLSLSLSLSLSFSLPSLFPSLFILSLSLSLSLSLFPSLFIFSLSILSMLSLSLSIPLSLAWTGQKMMKNKLFGSWTATLEIVDVRTRKCFPPAPGDGEKLFRHLGIRECPQEIRTKKSMFVLLFSFSDISTHKSTLNGMNYLHSVLTLHHKVTSATVGIYFKLHAAWSPWDGDLKGIADKVWTLEAKIRTLKDEIWT